MTLLQAALNLSSTLIIYLSYHNNTILENQYRHLLSASNCTNLQCLRSLDPASLKIATQQTYIDAYNSEAGLYAFGDFYYGPSVDGDLIRDLPSNEWKQGHFTKVPLLVDHNGYVSPKTTMPSKQQRNICLHPISGRLQLRQPKHNHCRRHPSRSPNPLPSRKEVLLRQAIPSLPPGVVQQHFLAAPISLRRLHHQLPNLLHGQRNGRRRPTSI